MPQRIRRDDEVMVIGGKDRGKTGRVLRVEPAKDRVYVEGLNMIKRHTRPRPGSPQPGGVIEKEGPIHVSNVALLDPKERRPTRLGTVVENGQRHRVARRSGEKV